jgi:transcriptional regulator with XRE-family HTH domain
MFDDKIASVADMDFSDWLLNEMNKRGWSQADLARASGINRQSVSDYVNRRRTNPDPDVLVSLSKGLHLSPITVFRAAGLLPPGGEHAVFADYEHLLSQLTPEEQDEIRQIIEIKIERNHKAKQVARAKSFKLGKASK